jgi:hypothetical protein
LAEPLKVDPIDLLMSSDHLAMHHAHHLEAHEAANASIESAGPGWVGSSAAALQAKLTDLQAVTSHISAELEHHRDAFLRIGHSYENIDEKAAEDIIRTHDNL